LITFLLFPFIVEKMISFFSLGGVTSWKYWIEK
jgi:hypothetical protein